MDSLDVLALFLLHFQLLKFDITAWRMFIFFKEKCFWKRGFFFTDEIISENSTAPILLLIVLISFIHFFFGHHCGKFVRIKNEIISTNCRRKNDSYEFVWVREQSLSEMLKVEKVLAADSRRSLVWFWDQTKLWF